MFAAIRNNNPKYIITLDDIFVPERNGIQIVNAIDFMCGRDRRFLPVN